MDKRYQVFVSSTYQDLREERQEVMHALLELDCIPAGMELFPAADQSQWELIKRVIGECDYYLLILGGRYGSVGQGGQSYTEMEYRYAVSVSKPIIAFIHKDPGRIIADKSESSPEGKKKLEDFREFVKNKMCKFWTSPEDLGSKVSRAVIQLVKSTPSVGWVRANELSDQSAVEMLGLRKHIEELEAELQRSRISPLKGTEDLAQGEDEQCIRLIVRFRDHQDRSMVTGHEFTVTWNRIFSAIAPTMIDEASSESISQALDHFAGNERIDAVRNDLQNDPIESLNVSYDDCQTILIQLRALGWIRKGDKPRSIEDSGIYWTLTPYGDALLTRLRAVRRTQIPPSQAAD